MGHKHDYWETVRENLLTRFGVVAQWIEDRIGQRLYIQSQTHNNQFVGRVSMDVEDFEKVLHDLGFKRNPLASYKMQTTSGEPEKGSWRKILNHDRQLHTILYSGEHIDTADDDYTYLYAHNEYRWDTHPWLHFLAKDVNGPEGRKKMKYLLAEQNIHLEDLRP